jgi:hypothetical protein
MISSGPPVELGNSILGMKDIFNMTTRSKMHHQYSSNEKICSEFIWQIFMGGLFLHKSFSLEQTRRILIPWKARGMKWWIGNEAKTGVNISPALEQQWVANEDHPGRPRWRHALLSCFFTDWHLVSEFTRSRTDYDPPIVSYFKHKLTCAFSDQTNNFWCFVIDQNTIFKLSLMSLRILSYHSK